MGIVLDLTGSGTPEVVAGFPEFAPVGPAVKTYEVALAIPGPSGFGTIATIEGNVYLGNSPTTQSGVRDQGLLGIVRKTATHSLHQASWL